ncbi:hypothetical protein SY83_22500 [Paenibacillus swuensis]|uniref:Lipoprotein n=1 Tax=Paenibacillus swuensis TaxID=1178515 RepID=A0A172TNH9_9BACL|nr:hypothetical protein [Paenibacillus swuensis]ANE48598.1 hypothetical protein SY83_22500 [Paenibacillus swuensis]
MAQKRQRKGLWGMGLVAASLLIWLTGCGGGPAEDVKISVIPQSGVPFEITEKLQTLLVEEVGATPTVGIYGSPVYLPEKLMLELAAGDNSIIITDQDIFKVYGTQGGFVELQNEFDEKLYPEGVLTAEVGTKDEPKQVTALYGVPLDSSGLFREAGLKDTKWIAFIPSNAPDVEQSLQVLKKIMEMK